MTRPSNYSCGILQQRRSAHHRQFGRTPRIFKGFDNHLEASGASKQLKRVEGIDPFHVRGFLATRFGRIKKVSVGRKLAAIRTFLRFLVRERIISKDPAAGIRAPKSEKPLPKALSVDEIDRFFSRNPEMKSRDLAAFELLYSSGLRVGELTSLKVQDVDLNNGWVRVIGKGNKERYVPVGSRAVAPYRLICPCAPVLKPKQAACTPVKRCF